MRSQCVGYDHISQKIMGAVRVGMGVRLMAIHLESLCFLGCGSVQTIRVLKSVRLALGGLTKSDSYMATFLGKFGVSPMSQSAVNSLGRL